jgi:hypothetical protein
MNIRLTKSPDRILFNIILIFVFLCPFIYLKGLYNYVTLPQSAFIQVFTLLILTIFTLSYLFSKKNISISTHPLNGAILFFLLWTLAASFYSHNHYEAFNQWYQWAACILLFFLLQIIIKSQSRALQLLGVIYAAGLFTAIIGLGQYLFNINIIPQSAPPSATFANKNMAAQFITLTFPLGIALLCWSRQRTFTWLAAMGSCVMIIFLIYTQTRAAWAAVCLPISVRKVSNGSYLCFLIDWFLFQTIFQIHQSQGHLVVNHILPNPPLTNHRQPRQPSPGHQVLSHQVLNHQAPGH